MGEPFDHRPAGWIRQSRKCCIQLIHNRMVVDYPSMSSVDFGVPDFCFLISPDTCANGCFPKRRVSQLGAWFKMEDEVVPLSETRS
jgi:hypothetical protein